MSSTLQHAQRLLGLGFSVIPLDHPEAPIANDPKQIGKTPALKWAPFQQALPSDDNLVAWFGNGRKRNIGIPTGAISNIVVVDTDTPDAEQWAADHLPGTPIQVLTAKGRHRYYRHPGKPVPNKARIRDGVDIRGDGGYVVAPGSVHASGHVYRAPDPWPDSLDGVPVFDLAWLGMTAPAPRWTPAPSPTARSTQDHDQLRTRARAYLERTPGAIEGQGGDVHTFQVCCRIVRGFQVDPADARDLLREWNAKCAPPWSDRDLEVKIDGALRYGKEPIGARAVDRPFVQAHRGDADVFPFTDTGNAEAFTAWHGERVRYDHRRKRPIVWGGHRWIPDADAEVERLAKETIRRRQGRAFSETDPDKRKAAIKWALQSESRQRREAMLAFWRRIRLVPFLRTFPVNPGLAEALKAEAPGILAWAVRGCLLWQAEGLGAPAAVVDATEAYQRDSDVLGDFLADACEVYPNAEIQAAELFKAYVNWTEQQGISERERLTQTMFGRKVSERFRKVRQGRGITYQGVTVRPS